MRFVWSGTRLCCGGFSEGGSRVGFFYADRDGWASWGAFANVCTEEETLLIGFFGMDYVRYRDRTRVGIPFIP